jgi:hypothetical protein
LMNADVKKASKRHVEEISEEDHLFSLDVSIFRRAWNLSKSPHARVNVCLNFRFFFSFWKVDWWVILFHFLNFSFSTFNYVWMLIVKNLLFGK